MTLVVGRNGSGKTELISTLSRLLHNADWKQSRIAAACAATYELPDQTEPIRLAYDGDRSTIRVGGAPSKTIADAAKPRNPSDDSALMPLLPSLVGSVFSTRGEYPERKTWNARGLSHTSLYDIAKLYGKHHYDMGSLSRGLQLLCSPDFEDARSALASVAELGVTNLVKVHPTHQLTERAFNRTLRKPLLEFWEHSDADWRAAQAILPWISRDWVELTDEVLRAEKEGLIYLNDVQFTYGKRLQSLMTLSAGQKMLLVRLLTVLSSIRDGSLVLFEEPELHLDPAWCAGLLELLTSFYRRFRAHMILTTQSPAVMRCFPSSAVVQLSQEGLTQPQRELFLASESTVTDMLYRPGALTSLDEAFLDRLGQLSSSQRRVALTQLGEGPVRFLAYLSAESGSGKT